MADRPQFARRQHRAQQILATVGRAYPHAWRQVDEMRAARGRDVPAWPAWCFLPLHGAYAIVSGGGVARVPIDRVHHIGILGALAAWRVGQGIYRFDEALATALRETPMPTDLPTSVLYRLPEWCVYLETPGLTFEGLPLAGFWAHLDWDDHGADELRLVLDVATTPDTALDARGGLIPLPLLLGQGGIVEALERVRASGLLQLAAQGYTVSDVPSYQPLAGEAWPLISLLLYLCADEPEIGDGTDKPRRPQPTRTKHGWRLFPADAPRIWDVGLRLGAALRSATADGEGTSSDGRARPRAHLRRAHWHSYWRGARDGERSLVVHWIPPTPVNVRPGEELPAVVHPVSE